MSAWEPAPDPDITVTRNAELMVAGIQGENHDGIEFVDAWMPAAEYEFTVADSGLIVVPEAAVADFIAAGRLERLIVAEESQ